MFPVVLAALVLLLVMVPVWQAWRAKVQLRTRLRTEWGKPRVLQRDMVAVADFFRSSSSAGVYIDDRTWNDLLMDDVFNHIDRTESSIGQQILYYRLRSAPTPRNLLAFEALVEMLRSDSRRRERAQVALAHLRGPAVYYTHRLARPGEFVRPPRWHAVFPIWTVVALITIFATVLWPNLLAAALVCFMSNFVIRQLTARQVAGDIAWFRTVGPLLSVAKAVVSLGNKETAAITGHLPSTLASLRRLGGAMRWLSRDPSAADPIVFALYELLNVLFLLDTNALYFGSGELLARGPQLLEVIESVGEIDAAIAIASFRVGEEWIRPRFAAPDAAAVLADIRHPLVNHAVPNSIAIAPPHGILITGSNMSGKSTFLRTVGINVVLAQTIHTCLASEYSAPVYRVRSCIGRSDDLTAGKSYYLVEVESVLSLVKASKENSPHLFIFDELFRGTNAVERIAGAEAVLHELTSEGKPHVVIAATHDGDLVDLLSPSYAVYHLSDTIGPDGLAFDYHLSPGPATTRNAIALLQLNGAPESLVSRAIDLAATLDRRRQA